MNYSVYIFGELSSGYTQYPEDSSSHELRSIYAQCKTPTQIAIHRDDSMMYYCYLRKLDSNKYIGLAIAINGYYLTSVAGLFSLFENTIERMARQGVFVHFAEDGSLTTSVKSLRFEPEEVKSLFDWLRQIFEAKAFTHSLLPNRDYTVAKKSIKEFSISDNKDDIIKASYTFGFTYIYKQNDFDTIRMNSYRSVLNKVNSENIELKKKNAALEERNKEILSQKKQYRNIIILCLLVVVCGIGLFFMKDNLDSTKSSLESAQREVAQKKKDIAQKQENIKALNEKVNNLQASLSQEKLDREKAENKLLKVENCMPVVITDVEIANVYQNGSIETDYGSTIYSSYTMYLKPKIKYTGIKSGEDVTLSIKLYTPNGLSRGSSSPSNCSWTESFYVYSGENTQSFQGWGGPSKGHWVRGSYRYEFWYRDVCLKSVAFTVY